MTIRRAHVPYLESRLSGSYHRKEPLVKHPTSQFKDKAVFTRGISTIRYMYLGEDNRVAHYYLSGFLLTPAVFRDNTVPNVLVAKSAVP